MGALPLLGLSISSFPCLLSPNSSNSKIQFLPFPSNTVFCRTYGSCAVSGSHHDGGRVRYSFKDDLDVEGDDLHDDFGFSSGAKQRAWWSDDNDYDDWEVEDDEEPWIFMVFRAFGWMLPAVAISLLLGTSSNAFLMALVVPLGQSVLSFAIDKVWGQNTTKSSAKTRSRKRPFARAAAARNMKTSGKKEEENMPGERRNDYKSWVSSDAGSYNKDRHNIPRYGGWDELDKQTETRNPKKEKMPPSKKANKSQKQQKKYKFSQIGRVRDRPLLLRLLIAVFPLLGSWTKLLF